MHTSAMDYGRIFFKTYCSNKSENCLIVDIGALNVNGSLRDYAPNNAIYQGVDFAEGKGVDVILTDPYELPYEDASVDVIVCSSVFEHSEFFWLLYLECIRILKPSGIMYLNVPSNGMVHRYPVDSWRFYPDSGHALAKWANHNSYDVVLLESFIGEKRGALEGEGMWNDFVAVFVKDKTQAEQFPLRIIDNIEQMYCQYDSRQVVEAPQYGYLPDYELILEMRNSASSSQSAVSELSEAISRKDDELVQLRNELGEVGLKLKESLAENAFHQEELLRARDSLSSKVRELGDLHAVYDALSSSYDKIVNDYSEITNSRSWYLTKPLRFIKRKLMRDSLFGKAANSALLKKAWRLLPLTVRHRTLIKNILVRPAPTVSVAQHNIPTIEFDSTQEVYVEYRDNPAINPLVKLIAFYLPQFHPFPENDQWWGKGFTEWSNVGKAERNYVGHYQPHCPIHNGYYDLRVPSVMEEQAALAKQYGVYGFSYYFYWFGGKILMDTPLEMMLKNPKVDMPFCLTWANENWTRRWDGQENDVLIAQNHSDEDSIAFIDHLIKYFQDSRYIKIDGKPVLVIYRASIIPNMIKTAKLWREEAIRHGFPDLYLICAQSFGIKGPEEFGFDASVEFPPHTTKSHEISSQLQITNPDFKGCIFSYDQVVTLAIREEEPDYKLFRTPMLSWDNTARKQNHSHLFHGFSLLRYKQWLAALCSNVYRNQKYSKDEKLVFVNAWNEWAEGTHLEPDRKYGYGYLQATYDVISNYDENLNFGPTRESFVKANDVAVLLHLHYLELWDEIKESLKSLTKSGFDLLVTTTNKDAIPLIAADYPNALIEYHENRGRDVFPMIKLMDFIVSKNYSAVCKLHTKKSVYRTDGDDIRGDLLGALVGSEQVIEKVVSRFVADPKLGVVVPGNYLTPHTDRNMTYDHEVVEKACKVLNVSFSYDQFPAGSMFWFRPSALSNLSLFKSNDFDAEQGLVDGTLPHAIERVFCIAAKSNGYKVEVC
jgi:lipopolysaccharide biosynthesis protein/SAM-dependent methyltransferase